MTTQSFVRLFEHNNWANLRIIEACSTLTNEQLDAAPTSATAGSIRKTLSHLVTAQLGYLRLLTVPFEERLDSIRTPTFAKLKQHMISSGEALLALARGDAPILSQCQIKTRDDYLVDAWVILVQAINHATEHREQIKSMLTALGVTPPEIDGWSYGDYAGGIVPYDKKVGNVS